MGQAQDPDALLLGTDPGPHDLHRVLATPSRPPICLGPTASHWVTDAVPHLKGRACCDQDNGKASGQEVTDKLTEAGAEMKGTQVHESANCLI